MTPRHPSAAPARSAAYAAIGQACQQKRDADAALGKRPYEGDRRDRQSHHHVFPGNHERHAQEGNHRANACHREPRCVACEFHSHLFGSVAGTSALTRIDQKFESLDLSIR